MFTRKNFNLNDSKVEEAIKKIAGKVPDHIKALLAYPYSEWQISSKKLRRMNCSLREYLYYSSKDKNIVKRVSFGDEDSFFSPTLFIIKGKCWPECSLKIYLGNELTCELVSLEILSELRDKFNFVQDGVLVNFGDVSPSVDAIAVSKESARLWFSHDLARVVVHYVPASRENEDEY